MFTNYANDLFILVPSILILYSNINMNTDFENIKKKYIFEVSILFYCIKCEYLVPKWIDSFAKSVSFDDSDRGLFTLFGHSSFVLYDVKSSQEGSLKKPDDLKR